MVKKVNIEEYYKRACTNAGSVNRKIITELVDVSDKRQKVEVSCNSCGNVNSVVLVNMSNDPRGCLSCKRSENFEYVVSNLESRGFFDVKKNNKKITYKCIKCSNDEYVAAGVCDGVFSSEWGNLKAGQTACRCSVKPNLTESQQKLRLLRVLRGRASFVRWKDGSYNNKSKVVLDCEHHGQWDANLSDILHSASGCPSCAKTGYSDKLPGTLYILKSKRFLKVGITNLSGKDRKSYVSRKSKEEFEVLKEWKWEDGRTAQNIEKVVLAELRKTYKNPDYKFHGYTECFESLDENFLVSLVESEIRGTK